MFVFFFDKAGAAVLDRPPAPPLRRTDYQKQFVDVFKRLSTREQSWRVWSDFLELAACAISNRVDRANYEVREKRYMGVIKRYSKDEANDFAKMLAILTQALDEEPEQDFLGELFMSLELSNHWRGQFFTPYSLCRMMAEMQYVDLPERVKEKGYISVNDPACGAGATLIAFANVAKARGINYQNHVLFVAQDIDQTAVLMCYLQMSLLGCAGYVIVGNTLTMETSEIWYTPMWFSDVWRWRRVFQKMSDLKA